MHFPIVQCIVLQEGKLIKDRNSLSIRQTKILLVYPESPGCVKRNTDTLAVGECCDGGGTKVGGGKGQVVRGGRLETVGHAGVGHCHRQRGRHGGCGTTHLEQIVLHG